MTAIRLFDPLRENAIPLADLHKLCFPDPWDPQAIERLSSGPGFALVHGPHSRPDGFAIARVAADEAELLTIATRPEQRHSGIGRALLREVAAMAAQRGARTLFLEVDATNEAALGLYNREGFAKTGVRKGYYKAAGQPRSDAVLMKATLPLSAPPD